MPEVVRVPESKNDVANVRYPFVVDRDCGQPTRGVDFQHRQVSQGIGADQQRFKHASILQSDDDLIGIINHVFVGDDIAALIHDNAGAERADLELVVRRAVHTAVIHVNNGGGGTANRRVIAGRRFISTVKLGCCKRINFAQRGHRGQQNGADD
ncbi:hypothetical protein D3C81_1745580 [compost metagenome]